jgi:hypothetical protein
MDNISEEGQFREMYKGMIRRNANSPYFKLKGSKAYYVAAMVLKVGTYSLI